LFAVLHALRVERAADDVVADARQIFHAAAADEHHRVLLQVVADAGDVGRDFDAVGQPYARYFAQRGVRFFRRDRLDLISFVRCGKSGWPGLAPVNETRNAGDFDFFLTFSRPRRTN
jgi:hypothetical protein